jgi:hypothetical protein
MRDIILFSSLLLGAAALAGLAVWIVFRIRRNPNEREKRRRLSVNARGRLADGNITEADDMTIFYSYSVGGVEYATSQDIVELRDAIQVNLEGLIGGPVTVKYATKNPANSIILCEEWSGLRPGIKGDNT